MTLWLLNQFAFLCRNKFSGSLKMIDTLQKRIDPDTGKLKFSRFHEYNLEERTVAGADLFRVRYYKTMTEASKAVRVPYQRLRSRVQYHQPVRANGGHNQAVTRRRSRGLDVGTSADNQSHPIEGRALVQHANAIFAARGDCQSDKQAAQRWARRFIKRNAHIFKRTATHSRMLNERLGQIDQAKMSPQLLQTYKKVEPTP
ncbi:hypothetical protein E4U19_000140 [Claviceps sp. Clav32 group G5]|nr:hypothetical protein E4U19_000140 [Claviceps sp. Clav32 group G5]